MALPPSTKLGSFEISGLLGTGGMGEVYRARDSKLGREVAIKVLPEAFAEDQQRLERFEREARLLASLDHPNIAAIYESRQAEGVRFLVMQLAEGRTLAERIWAGPIPVDEALPLFAQIAAALEYAHGRGVIHRDLKPDNIKITSDGQVKLLDFGLAKALEMESGGDANRTLADETLAAGLTSEEKILGTPAYMSPEQARGRPVDRRADIWSFGCCLYQALTGEPPFRGETLSDVLADVLRGEPDWSALSEATPQSLRRLLHRCLRKEPEQRLRDIGDVALEIGDTQVGSATPGSTLPQTTGNGGRPRAIRMAAWALAVLVVLGGAALVLTWPRPMGLVLELTGAAGPPVDPRLPDRPSIAVLPFSNMSDDPEQEYFSDGISEELTSGLGRFPELFVAARNSAFTYKGQAVKIETVGRELGVRYVLEGSVRKAGGRVRVTARLADAESGGHIWSDSYTRDLADLFDLQHEISQEILGAVGVEIDEVEFARTRSRPTDELTAYDTFLGGRHHFNRLTRQDNGEARLLFEHAIDLDPDYAAAYALLGSTYTAEYAMGWNVDPELIDRASELVEHSLELDPFLASGYTSLAALKLWQGESEEAVEAAVRAVDLSPNSEICHGLRAMAQASNGEFLQAMGSLSHALRLSPRHPSTFWMVAGYMNARVGRMDRAVDLWERVRKANPDLILPRIQLVAHYENQGRDGEARTVADEILAINPDLTAELALEISPVSLDSAAAARFEASLRRAGLP